MNVEVTERDLKSAVQTSVIDSDIHPALRSPTALDPYLSQRWRDHMRRYGYRLRDPVGGRVYPTSVPALSRRDSWPPNGGPPGSDLAFMREQHLDPLGIEYGILQPLVPAGRDERNPEFSAAICAAMNDWQVAEWTSQEPRLKASICVPTEDTDATLKEIERCAPNPAFAQVFIQPRLREPLGTKRYWPMYEAAAHYGLPVGMHTGGGAGVPVTGSGWPSFYGENHFAHSIAMQAAVTNLVLEGVFERFPALKIIVVEGSFAWAPSLGWRMDKYWERLRDEVPHLRRPPSEYLRDNVWFTTQPMDEPERRRDLLDVFEWIGWDRILFATDYPHWDSDDPRFAFQVPLPEERRQQVLAGNARSIFRLN